MYPDLRRFVNPGLFFPRIIDDLFDGFGAATSAGCAPASFAKSFAHGRPDRFVTPVVSREERAVVFFAQRLRGSPELRAALELLLGKCDFRQALEVPGDAVVVLVFPAQGKALTQERKGLRRIALVQGHRAQRIERRGYAASIADSL